MDVTETYDALAATYDERYTDPHSRYENAAVTLALAGLLARTPAPGILDVGAGTGLLLDLMEVDTDEYVAVDPSKRMLDRLREKHPGRHAIEGTLGEFLDAATIAGTTPPGAVVALFGVGSLLDPDEIRRLIEWAPDACLMLMFYAPGYLPDYYTEHPDPDGHAEAAAHDLFRAVVRWSNYVVYFR